MPDHAMPITFHLARVPPEPPYRQASTHRGSEAESQSVRRNVRRATECWASSPIIDGNCPEIGGS